MSHEPILSWHGMTVDFAVDGGLHRAVDGVRFDLEADEVLAVVGESGSGKSVTAMASVGLLPGNARVGGEIVFEGRNLLAEGRSGFAAVRGSRIGMIFQDPMNALDPVFTIGSQLIEMIRCHHAGVGRRSARDRAVELLDMVEIDNPDRRLQAYPHQLSGGQCQRVMIAMALACDPQVLIADEPTTALDVTVQQEVLDVLLALRSRTSCSIMIITHDMGVVADVADRVVVMRSGCIVEEAPAQRLFDNPEDPYTRALLAAVPRGRSRDDSAGRDGGIRVDSRDRPDVDPDDERTTETAGRSPALLIKDLMVRYPGRRRRAATAAAVQGAGLRIDTGETLGLVGESGSGKSTVGKCVLGLAPITAGTVRVGEVEIRTASADVLRRTRSRIGVVFQNPTASLNPRYTIGESIAEPLRVHRGQHGPELDRRVGDLLASVELPADWSVRFPHELSGGQRQRVSIARAISMQPDLLIADEPTSALDVSVQATVLTLLSDLQQQLNFACLFISHDLAVVDQVCDRIAVMSGGRIVEQGDRGRVLGDPRDDYTRRLLQAAPVPDPAEQSRRRQRRLAPVV
ncbi:dipeptide ABC transporter ATP-binding protein [Microlunatus soli]|uniref:Peptide/nickel transport system ATP-binding protein n=1 Tax=Microlunatus soli TaxID=630515 RepID=A0A1H1NY00_9ACTN|nr:ABC transporter ATP-binding protein [Microlunatus soli]SDS03670.1 peptide/nickel transport system ATP-binding protein [Microlunatus soli]